MESDSNETQKKANFTDLALTLFRRKHGRSEQNQKVQALSPHVPALVTFADHSKLLPWGTTYHSVLMFADISGFTSLCERYSTMEKSGIDELTSTLNSYMGSIVDGILTSDGDVLKYAGDAILALWRVNDESELPATVDRVLQCCLDIQEQFGEWETDVGVKLTVKMGLAAGDMTMAFLGNDEFRHYVELGPVVSDVNKAESFCKSGYVVLSPHAWELCNCACYDYELMEDGSHVRVTGVAKQEIVVTKTSSPEILNQRDRRFSLAAATPRFLQPPPRRLSLSTSTPSKDTLIPPSQSLEMRSRIKKRDSDDSMAESSARKTGFSTKTMSGVLKLRNVVKTVTAMKLEETLRLYILSPVLKKIDDNQPLEYLSEMRQVSIVFMNLVLDSDVDSLQILQQIFDIVFSSIKVVHGCLNKIFLFDKGCTFLVIFGLPGFKHERDCAHALQNSVQMKKILDELHGIARVSIGVTTGTTFCGVIGHRRRHEYSVIGRKVNMAARLMMHYPNKVTCDDDTFQSCRLPPENFVVLVTKRMKGLRNIGIIREFNVKDDKRKTDLENSIPYFEYPILGRDWEKKVFLEEVHNLVSESLKRFHIVYVGAAGIGKTRLLDSLCNLSVRENIRVISISLNLHNASMPYFLVKHLLRMMLSCCGYSQEVEKEPVVMETMRLFGMDEHIEATKELLSAKPIFAEKLTSERSETRLQVVQFLINMCLDTLGPTSFIIDDMHFCDKQSWECIQSLGDHRNSLIVLAFRSYAVEQPSCPAAQRMFDEKRSIVKDVFSLDSCFLAPLACQYLHVISIPKELDRLLGERSQGVPSWVEQLLRDMYERRQIFIHSTDCQSSVWGSVAPREYLITKAEIVLGTERRRPSITPDFSDISSSTQTGSQNNMLVDLGFLVTNSPRVKDKKEHRICVMAPGINIQNISVPDSMKDLVIARIDSMRPTEQLIVKCAAILDPPFTRQMLEEVLPQASTFKVSSSIMRLFENGTFECFNIPKSSFCRADDKLIRRDICHCTKNEIDDEMEILCNQLKFRHNLLKDTAKEMLMGKQKQHLHQKAAEFIEHRIRYLRMNVPFQLFVKNKTEPTSKMTPDQRTSSDKCEGNDKQSTDEQTERFQAILKSGEMLPHLSLILEGAMINYQRNSSLEQLLPEYSRIKFHYGESEDMFNLLDTQTEAALIAIVLKKTEEALKWLREAKATFEKLEHSTNQTKDLTVNLKYIHAGLERLHGKALHQSGQLIEARERLIFAAELLDFTIPATKISRCFQMFKLHLSTFPQFIYFTKKGDVRQLKKASRKRVERGHLLGDLCRLHKDQGKKDLLFLDAWRHASNIIGKDVHIHQVLESYIHLISACRTRQWWKQAERLETELYATCCARSQELLFDDVKELATTLGEGCHVLLNAGNLVKALDRGIVAASLVGHMNHTRLSVRIYPLLALTYLAADQYNKSVDLLERLESIPADLEGWGVDTWSTVISLELMLSSGIPSHTFLMCLKRASISLKSYDAVIDGSIARYYIAMCIALWYSRKGDWQEAQSWFDYWENYEPSSHNYITVSAWTKKMECMLLSMCRAIEMRLEKSQERIKHDFKQEFQKLKKTVKTIKGWRSRYFHLGAYYKLLQSNLSQTRSNLIKCGKSCLKHGNVLEFRNLESSWQEWYSQTITSNDLHTDWIDKVNQDILYRPLRSSSKEQVLYVLPLPQGHVTRKPKCLRWNKIGPV